ncbi:MAG: hypothetical protein GTO03_14175, partial [Planctomycetales bacterium]|nr:hypothetical protein [Planctomycetales bacterium]
MNAVQPHPALVAVERDALVAEWDLGDVNPVLSYRQAEAKVDWSFPSQPQTPTTQGTRSLSISYGPREVTLGLEADLQTSGGYLFGHQLELPAGLQVEEVEVRGAGQPLVRRWAQAGPQLSVFLTGPVTGPHQLQVRGRMPRVGAIEQPPAIQLQNVRWNESRLAVYRQDTVLV